MDLKSQTVIEELFLKLAVKCNENIKVEIKKITN